MKINGNRLGFTLMEVLIAITAGAIVLAAINSVFYGALRLRNKTAEIFDQDLALQHTLALLRKDIANLVPPGGLLSGKLQTTSVASSGSGPGAGVGVSAGSMALLAAASRPGQSSPEFYTTTGTIDETSPWSEIQKVAYYLAPSTNAVGARDLIRSVTRNLLPSLQDQPVPTPVLSGVESIYFQFYDGTQWVDSWDSTAPSTARLPAAIRAQITLASAEPARGRTLPAPIEIVVPILVDGGTNSTESSNGAGGGGAQ